MTKIGLLGDVHGDKEWIKFALWKFARESITNVLQVGDFGIGSDSHSESFLKIANEYAKAAGIFLRIIPGNHENWELINRLFERGEHYFNDGWATLRSNILVAPRGLRWEWDGVTFVALGGAPSVDRGWRRRADAGHPNAKNKLWYSGEMITLEDVYNTVQGGYADVMLAHDAPRGVPTVDKAIYGNPHGFERADILYANDGRDLMDQAFRGVGPRTFIHGHYHRYGSDMVRRPNWPPSDLDGERDLWTHVLGLDMNGRTRSLGHYDTEEKEAYAWDTRNDLALYRTGRDTWAGTGVLDDA